MSIIRIAAALLILGFIVMSVSTGASGKEINPDTLSNVGSFSISSEVKAKADFPADLPKTRAASLKYNPISGGYWEGGNLNNGGYGTIVSYAPLQNYRQIAMLNLKLLQIKFGLDGSQKENGTTYLEMQQ